MDCNESPTECPYEYEAKYSLECPVTVPIAYPEGPALNRFNDSTFSTPFLLKQDASESIQNNPQNNNLTSA